MTQYRDERGRFAHKPIEKGDPVTLLQGGIPYVPPLKRAYVREYPVDGNPLYIKLLVPVNSDAYEDNIVTVPLFRIRRGHITGSKR